MLPVLLLLTPLLTALVCRLVEPHRMPQRVSAAGAVLTLAVGLATASAAFGPAPLTSFGGYIYVDALSALLVVIVVLVGGGAALMSADYLHHEVLDGDTLPSQSRAHYCWLHLSIFAMLAVPLLNNLGLLWVAMEATTLATALLVGFHGDGPALEAAWKYLIICTVGIAFALFGVLLVYYAAGQVVPVHADPLNWDQLYGVAGHLDPTLMKLCFIFVLVGFGTKAGLAPMHTWLPDAHSQAPAPISALLSGALLSCALYAIFRFHILAVAALGPDFSSHLLLIFGAFSVAVSVPFILVQYDLKRLLAYSSVEHIGIIAVGVGIGGPLGLFAASFHMVNHALAKSALFFAAGRIGRQYGALRLSRLHGAVRVAPVAGSTLLLGSFAITGVPPFATFASEFGVVSAGFQGATSTAWTISASTILIVALAFVFAGMVRHGMRVTLGAPPAEVKSDRPPPVDVVLLILPLVALLVGEFWLPPPVMRAFTQVAAVLGGVAP